MNIYSETQIEPGHSIRYKLASAPIKDSDQTAHMRSLISDFDRRFMNSQGSSVFSGCTLGLRSDCADAQDDLNFLCRHMRTFTLCWIPAQIFKYRARVQRLSGIVFESRVRCSGFEPHWRHCVVSLSNTLYPRLSTGSMLLAQ